MDTEKELDEVLAALAMVQISGAQQFVERKRRFLMLMREDKAVAVSEERERCKARAVQIVEWHRNDYNRQQIDPIVAELWCGL